MSNISYREAVLNAANQLQKCGVDNPQYDSRELLMSVANMDRTAYLLHCEENIDDKLYIEFQKLVKRRAAREPLQHILGYTYFWGRKYQVNKNVLIPRQDTEVLVEKALECIDTGDSVLDMCTGSGCIIITLACEKKLSRAVGVDISKKALEVAKENSANLLADVEWIESDLFQNLNLPVQTNSKMNRRTNVQINLQVNLQTDMQTNTQMDDSNHLYDVIVSNPPYIEQNVINTLSDEVRYFDPLIALDGGEDGLLFYRKITEQSVHYLKSGGWLLYEIGNNQSVQVKEIMASYGYENIHVIKDLAGLCRVVMGRLQ